MIVKFSYSYLEQDPPNGIYREECEKFLEETFGVNRVLMTPSCTSALELAAIIYNVGEIDNVFVPAYTFVSTVNAFATHRARPTLIDIEEETLNMNLDHLEEVLSMNNFNNRVIVPVHYAGVGVDMDRLMEIAGCYDAFVVEDNAQGLFAKRDDYWLGTQGHLSATSFHHTKNFSCGEGGALFVNDPMCIESAEIAWANGTNWLDFYRGKTEQYVWKDHGGNHRLADPLASLLMCQFRNWEAIQDSRMRMWNKYYVELQSWAKEKEVRLPTIPDSCSQSYHMFYLLLPTEEDRDELKRRLAENDICATTHYVPLNLTPMGRVYGFVKGQCPVAEKVASTILRLPMYLAMTEEEQKCVIDTIHEIW